MKYLNRINGKIYSSYLFGSSKIVIKNNGTVEVIHGKNGLLRNNYISLDALDNALIDGTVLGYCLDNEKHLKDDCHEIF